VRWRLQSDAVSDQANPSAAFDAVADLALALELVDLADEVTMLHYRAAELVVDRKADRTEVTAADRGAEAAIGARLAEVRPGDAVFGEEHGSAGAADARRRWIIDPVDGTSNFVRHVPVWATLLALEADGELVVGVASAPAMGRRWWAARGLDAHTRDVDGTVRRIHVSSTASLSDAFLSWVDGPWDAHGMRDGLARLRTACGRERGFGDFWPHLLVAEGAIDVACEPIVAVWDLAALQPIVEEAGGWFGTLQGVARHDGGSAVSTTLTLRDQVLDTLRDRS
jgi:histidinol-phosphatase